MIFSAALTVLTVDMMALGRGVFLCDRVQLLAIVAYGLMVVPMFWGEYPKGSPFLFIYKKGI